MLPRSTCIAVLLALALVIDRTESFTPSFLPHTSRTIQRSASSTTLQMAIDKLDPSETALVLIEYQNEFTTEGGALYGSLSGSATKNSERTCLSPQHTDQSASIRILLDVRSHR